MTTARKRRRKKTTTGSRFFAILGILFLIAAGSSPAAAQNNRTKNVEPYAVVAGTVFRDPGFAVPGAEIVLSPAGESTGRKIKKQKDIANSRGEFAFRVPPGPADYIVTATAKGFNKIEKSVTVHAEERVDVTFVLAPSSNK